MAVADVIAGETIAFPAPPAWDADRTGALLDRIPSPARLVQTIASSSTATVCEERGTALLLRARKGEGDLHLATKGTLVSTTTRDLPRIRISDAGGSTAAQPEPSISAAPMLVRERALHLPLLPWAERLLGTLAHLREHRGTVYEFAYDMSRVGNNTSLMAVHDGEGRTAAGLVRRQLRWINRLIRRSGNVGITDFAVSPWTNHARLDTFRGDWDSALRRLQVIDDCRRRDTLRLGAGAGQPGVGLATADREGYKRYLRDLYVTESLKSLLVNRRWQEVLDFAAGLGEGDPDWIARSVDEAVVVAACKLGDFDRAEQVSVDAIRLARGWDGAALRVRRAEVLACAARTERAEAALLGMLPAMCAAPIEAADTERVLGALYPLLRAAALAAELGMEDECATLAERTFTIAAAAGDEVFQIESARLLARAAAAERERWQEAVERLESATMYKRFRRGRDEAGGATLARLYDEASAAFDQL
jgi:hypothetical protein